MSSKLLPGDLVLRNNLHVGFVHVDDDTPIWNVIISDCLDSRKLAGHPIETFLTYNLTLGFHEEVTFMLPHTIYEYFRDGKQIFPS